MTFNANDLRKKTLEVRLCVPVAQVINERDGTDYFVEDPQHYLETVPENAIEDVVFFSKSGAYPAYPIQVCTTPSKNHLELRSPNGNIESFRRRLSKALTESGVKYATVNVSLTKQSVLHNSPTDVVTRCSDLLVQCDIQENSRSLDWRDINAFSQGLYKFVRHIHVTSAASLNVFVSRAEWVPSDGRLIQESVSEKERKYAPALKAQTALVIGGSSFIDYEQVDNYLASGNARDIRFREAWSVFENRVVPLKQNAR